MLALTADDIRTLVPMRDAIAIVARAFRDLSEGRAAAPLRTPIEMPHERAVTLFMPASVPSADGLGLKVVSVFPNNPERGKPLIHALVCLVDPEDGTPLAIMDGTYLTALRTGAVSGVATQLLARPHAHVLALFGGGAQAMTQAAAICEVRPIADIRVVTHSPASAAAFIDRACDTLPEIGTLMRPVADPREALSDADIVCAATTTTTPLFDNADLAPGTHINGVGSYTPTMQEVPAETVARAVVVVDQRAAAWAEAGDLIIAKARGLFDEDRVHADLGELVSGAQPGRTNARQITFFKSVGNAVQDIAVARYAVDQAMERDVGQQIALM